MFVELDDYIFVHGGIDPTLEDWRKASRFEYVWTYEVKMDPVQGKTVVAGHHRVATIRKPYATDYRQLFLDDPSLFDPMYLEGKILIDRFVEVSKELNVLVLDIEKADFNG
jgi:serine/threonine protein phosphatase 1